MGPGGPGTNCGPYRMTLRAGGAGRGQRQPRSGASPIGEPVPAGLGHHQPRCVPFQTLRQPLPQGSGARPLPPGRAGPWRGPFQAFSALFNFGLGETGTGALEGRALLERGREEGTDALGISHLLCLLSFLPISVPPVQAEITRSSREAQRGIAQFQTGGGGNWKRLRDRRGADVGIPCRTDWELRSLPQPPHPGPCPKGPCG